MDDEFGGGPALRAIQQDQGHISVEITGWDECIGHDHASDFMISAFVEVDGAQGHGNCRNLEEIATLFVIHAMPGGEHDSGFDQCTSTCMGAVNNDGGGVGVGTLRGWGAASNASGDGVCCCFFRWRWR